MYLRSILVCFALALMAACGDDAESSPDASNTSPTTDAATDGATTDGATSPTDRDANHAPNGDDAEVSGDGAIEGGAALPPSCDARPIHVTRAARDVLLLIDGGASMIDVLGTPEVSDVTRWGAVRE